ncbi:hypothetical protein NQ318_012072 [Aromia moschata]|uniref:Uncharacterized protein n=1 Tax=Aromia moschata TaxID=1265417 RepID=A0AAV8Y5N7_9CUCU|nr:hypothetical protein NQ318_012072 [Aromia moschata]
MAPSRVQKSAGGAPNVFPNHDRGQTSALYCSKINRLQKHYCVGFWSVYDFNFCAPEHVETEKKIQFYYSEAVSMRMKTENVDMNLKSSHHENVLPPQGESVINVKVSEVVLTPLCCASLVNEILKGVLYQKSQIPYPYNWLKTLVENKRKQADTEEPKKPINFTAVNHFRVVSSTYDTLECVMNGIMKEFRENGSSIKEVIFVFGTTPQCPKEVFTINVSSVVSGHLEKKSYVPYGNIFLSQSWMDAIDATSVCTNTFIFLKKDTNSNTGSATNIENFFIPSRPLTFPPKLKHVKIKLNHSDSTNCCSNLTVFEDAGRSDVSIRNEQLTSSENCEVSFSWYQAKDLLKGFKDCYINKISACELWLIKINN